MSTAGRLLCMFVLLAVPAAAQPSLDDLLARPASPATEALLLAHASNAQVSERWTRTLADPSAHVRAVVARAIQAAGATALLAPLVAQLDVERDLAAAIEQAKTLVVLTGTVPANAEAAIAVHGGPLAASILRALARAAPAQAQTRLSATIETGDDGELAAIAVLTQWMRAGSPEAARAQSALLRRGDEQAFRVLVGASIAAERPIDVGRVVLGLRSTIPGVVDLALAALLHRPVRESPGLATQGVVVEAVESLLERLDDQPAPTQLLATLLARRLGRPLPGRDLGSVAGRVPIDSLVRRLNGRQLAELTSEERNAIHKAWDTDLPKPVDEDEATGSLTEGGALVRDLPGPLLEPLLSAARCARGGSFGVVRVTYDATGRAAEVRVAPELLSGACVEAFGVAARLTRAPEPGVRTVFIPRDRAYPPGFAARQALEPRRMPAWYTEQTQRFSTPKLERQVAPEYPADALRQRVEGRVWLEVLIDESGRVAGARVARSAHPMLDTVAILTMPKWRFRPASVDDRPVPVVVLVEMEFALRDRSRR